MGRIHVEKKRGPEDRSIDRDLPGRICHEQRAVRRNVIQTESFGPEVKPMKERERRHDGFRHVWVETEGIHKVVPLVGVPTAEKLDAAIKEALAL